MSSSPPLVVAILHSDEDDIDYQLYCEAYGIEMQVDDEWNAEAVLLAPYDHLYAVTENTDVTGEDAAIVSAGATDIPISDDGSPEISVIKDSQNNWLESKSFQTNQSGTISRGEPKIFRQASSRRSWRALRLGVNPFSSQHNPNVGTRRRRYLSTTITLK